MNHTPPSALDDKLNAWRLHSNNDMQQPSGSSTATATGASPKTTDTNYSPPSYGPDEPNS